MLSLKLEWFDSDDQWWLEDWKFEEKKCGISFKKEKHKRKPIACKKVDLRSPGQRGVEAWPFWCQSWYQHLEAVTISSNHHLHPLHHQMSNKTTITKKKSWRLIRDWSQDAADEKVQTLIGSYMIFFILPGHHPCQRLIITYLHKCPTLPPCNHRYHHLHPPLMITIITTALIIVITSWGE